MKKLLFVLLLLLARTNCVWASDCCKDAWIPELCNPQLCSEIKKEDIKQQRLKKFYYGQYNACLRALKNAESLNKINISSKKQQNYCKCVAEQMIERVDLKAVGDFVAVGMSASALSLIEFNIDAAMSICEEKLDIHLLSKTNN